MPLNRGEPIRIKMYPHRIIWCGPRDNKLLSQRPTLRIHIEVRGTLRDLEPKSIASRDTPKKSYRFHSSRRISKDVPNSASTRADGNTGEAPIICCPYGDNGNQECLKTLGNAEISFGKKRRVSVSGARPRPCYRLAETIKSYPAIIWPLWTISGQGLTNPDKTPTALTRSVPFLHVGDVTIFGEFYRRNCTKIS
jgi:hypothetical protein